MPDLQAKLRFLQQSASYGPDSGPVESIETHMSWVFLVGQRAYKLKKPVHFALLDFTTLAARAHFCREEVRLNSRLAPAVYLGVAALQSQGDHLTLVPDTDAPATGDTVDWLVVMRKLPAERMLPHMVAHHNVTPSHVDALARLLGNFYRQAAVITLSAADYQWRFQAQQASNRELLLHPGFALIDAACALDRLDTALGQVAALLRARAQAGRIREGHGDLRPDHVCLLDPPVVIDCLEFNPQLREVDPFDELSLLRLECDRAQAPWIGRHLLSAVSQVMQDWPPAGLLHFYAAHHALMRARLAVSHLLDPVPRTPQKWLPLAERYIACALVELTALEALPPGEFSAARPRAMHQSPAPAAARRTPP